MAWAGHRANGHNYLTQTGQESPPQRPGLVAGLRL